MERVIEGSALDMTNFLGSEQRLAAFGGLRLLFLRYPLPVLLFDPQWLNVIAVNPAATTLYGRSEAEFLGLTIADLVAEEELGAFLRMIEPRAEPGAQARSWQHRCRDGRQIAVEFRIEAQTYRDHAALLAIAQSVDGAAPQEQAPAASTDASATRPAGEYLAHLSHELHAPLDAMIGFSELLAGQEASTDPSQARYLAQILEAGRHLLRLVDSVPDLQRSVVVEGGRPAQPPRPTAPEDPDDPGRPMPSMRVLYVEDNRINAMLFEAVLGARQDIELRIAESGREALDLVETWVPDALVLDANLPDVHGIRLLGQMRERESLKTTPAFMCSADAWEEDVRLAGEAGFTDYWTKPVDFNRVIGVLRELARPAENAETS